jgi:hypothetical protein
MQAQLGQQTQGGADSAAIQELRRQLADKEAELKRIATMGAQGEGSETAGGGGESRHGVGEQGKGDSGGRLRRRGGRIKGPRALQRREGFRQEEISVNKGMV